MASTEGNVTLSQSKCSLSSQQPPSSHLLVLVEPNCLTKVRFIKKWEMVKMLKMLPIVSPEIKWVGALRQQYLYFMDYWIKGKYAKNHGSDSIDEKVICHLSNFRDRQTEIVAS